MTETIIIIILSAIAIILAAGFIKEIVMENKDAVQEFLNDTGYEVPDDAIQVRAKVVDIFEPDSSPYMPSPYAQYDGIVFKLEDGRRLNFFVPPGESFAMNIGVTGILYYLEPDGFLNFVPDTTQGKLIKHLGNGLTDFRKGKEMITL